MAESMRPYRHLCPEADERDAMSESDFWARVGRNLGVNSEPYEDDGPDLDQVGDVSPCAECGSVGACAYDSEGRPLIHAASEGDD